MKKAILYCAGAILTTLIVFEAIVLTILLLPRGSFAGSYYSTLQSKYDLLRTTDSPRIVILGGSNTAYGINADAITEATGYPVVNMGLNAGMRYTYANALAEEFVGEGDIILLAYEYVWQDADYFETIGTDALMVGIDDRIDMYQYMPMRYWPSILGYLFDHAAKKPHANAGTIRDWFSEDGNQMMITRKSGYDLNSVEPETIDTDISEGSVNALREFQEYMKAHGASVYFVAAPYAEGCFTNPEDLTVLAANEEAQIGIPFISDPLEYAFDPDEMYDTYYHCNSYGQEHRTQLLIQDLASVGISAQ